MAVPPTSPLRAIPQPVAIDVQGFMPQTNLVDQTISTMEAGMKLPLLREKVELEKLKLNADKAQLKFAERGEQVKRDMALAQLEAQKLQNAKLQLDVDMDTPQFDMSALGASFGPSPTSPPLADISSLAPTAEPGASAAPSVRRRPTQQTLETQVAPQLVEWAVPTPEGPVPASPQDYAEHKAREAATRVSGARPVGSMRDVAAFNKALGETRSQFTPERTTFEFVDDEDNLPYAVEVIKVGSELGLAPGATPRINVNKLSPAQKETDTKFGEFVTDYVTNTRPKVQGQIERLEQAVDILKGGNVGFVRGMLPTAWQTGLGVDNAEAETNVRQFVVTSLKEALGSAGGGSDKTLKTISELAYSRSVSPEENARRVRLFIDELKEMDASRQRALNYYETNGTLAGFGTAPEVLTNPASRLESRMRSGIASDQARGQADALRAMAVEAYVNPRPGPLPAAPR
jgi:hypothetical protein